MDLIVGATGKLGRAIVRRRLEQGHAVRALARDPRKADDLRQLGAQIVHGDLRDPGSLAPALQGVSHVVAAAHALLGGYANSMKRVDGAGHRALIDAARTAGVERFVYTSIMGASADHPHEFWRTKARTEDYLKQSGLSYTILRPSAYLETHAHQLIGEPFLRRGVAVLLGRGQTVRNFVSLEDVAVLAVRALDDALMIGETIDVGGADNLTDREIVELYASLTGRSARMRLVPVAVLRVLALLLRPLHPGAGRIMRMSLLLDSGTVDWSFDPVELKHRYGLEPVRLADWIRSELQSHELRSRQLQHDPKA
jgi:uncharacterized protein YbjT (DUF2867 family)